MEAEPAGASNPYGNAFFARETQLTTEQEAQQVVDPLAGRYWKVVNPRSPWVASLIQTAICLIWIVFLTFVIVQPQANGNMNYTLGIEHGSFVPAGGIGTYGWLATIGTMTLIVVYCLTAIAAPLYARRRQREFSDNEFTHVVAPIVGILVMLLPLLSLFLPFFGLEGVLTNIGFAPSPFPVNILPAFFFIWLIVGVLLLIFFIRRSDERYNRIGHFVRTND